MKQLVDKAKITVKAGNGGDGSASFKHEKYIPMGGPDGGDGGDGGDVYIVGEPNMATLMDFRSRPKYAAEDGGRGMGKKMFGKDGKDLNIKVPLGTLVYLETETGPLLIADVVEADKPILVAQGGKGGLGNVHFKSSTHQAPKEFTPGIKGEIKDLQLEIKLLADIGLVGLPNAGKSTLINSLTGSATKIGSYPFTTLVPNLAPLKLKSGKNVIVADIPGLIEGASTGKGLGDDFLRHIERTRLIVHMIDPTSVGTDIVEDLNDIDLMVKNCINSYKVIRKELDDFNANLQEKIEIIVINKIDITEVRKAFEYIKDAFSKLKFDVLGVSAYTGDGFEPLLNKLTEEIEKAPDRIIFESTEVPAKIYTPDNLPNRRMVQKALTLE